MKRLFTLAVIALTASLTFAQAPLAKKSTLSANRLERMLNVEEIAKAAKETKVLEAAKAEKAAAAKETGRSVLRKSSANRDFALSRLTPVETEHSELAVNAFVGMRKATANKGFVLNQLAPMKADILKSNGKMLAGKRKADANDASIEGTWTFSLGDYYFQTSTGSTITADFEATLEDGIVTFQDTTSNYLPFFASYDEAAGTLTFPRLRLGTSQGYYIYQEPFVYNYDTNKRDNQTIVATYNASAGTISFESDNGIEWSAYSDQEGTTLAGYYFIFDLEGATKPGELTITTDLVVLPTGAQADAWYMNAVSQSSTGGTAIKNQSVNVAFFDNDVYVQGISTAFPDAWVKGTISGNAVKFDKFQYVGKYNNTHDCWFIGYNTTGKVITDATATYDAAAKTITFKEDLLINAAIDKVYYLNWFSNVVVSEEEVEDPELVVLPADAQVAGWYMNGGTLEDQNEVELANQNVNVAFVDNDVYVQGISPAFPTAWVKGTIDGTTITFDRFQFVGVYSGLNCWFVGVNPNTAELKDATATYNAEAKTITFADDILINAAKDKVYYLNWFFDVVLSEEEAVIEEPVITTLTTELPYLNTFDTDEEQAEVAIYDANDDASTFSFIKHSTTGSMTARYRYSSANEADDYLVFPGMSLKAGSTYKISLDAAAYGPSYPERLEVVAGTEAKASQLTIPVIPATVVDTKDFNTLSNTEFTVEEDGTYYIAVHAISDKNEFYLYVDNFSVSELSAEAPVAVSDLAAVADAEGANKATVTFTVPAQTLGGEAITEALTVTVKRDGEEIWSETKAAGEAVTVADETPAAGYYTYAVTAAYSNYVSDAAEIKVYVGYDTPAAVTNVTVADKSGAVALVWDAPEGGAEGYIVNPADFKYNIYPVEMVSFWGMTFPSTDFENPYATGVTETSATIEYDTNEGDHGYTYFAVTAENTTGESEDTYGAVVTGAPYDMPVFESAAGGSLSYWWGYSVDRNNQSLEGGLYLAENASDEDGYCFEMVAETMGYVELQSGKVALAGAANPVLTFDYAGESATPLTITVVTPKGANEIKTLTTAADWATAEISLVEYANEDWVRVLVKGTFAAAGSAFIDNVRIYNMLDNNLVAGAIKATSSVEAGEDVTVTVTVENQGASAVAEGAYTVALYCNDAKVQTLAGVALEKNAKTTFEFTEATNVMTAKELVWKAVVEFAADNDQANNTTGTAKTIVKTSNYPTVADLAGALEDNTVTLTWSAPEIDAATSGTVTDDFESYDSFAVNAAGDWTFIDVDASNTYSIDGMTFENGGAAMAYIVLDNSGDDFNQSFDAHSGNKYMASFAAVNGPNNDWMISPELSGEAQTVSFFAKTYTDTYGAESFEFYYSTTGKEIADFTKLGGDEAVPTDWTEYTFDVPEGAKYFAIRCTSNDRFIFLVDDVTYSPAGVVMELTIAGYNVYRDGVKLNADLVEATAYTDTNVADGEHNYGVTVVYDKGESAISNVVTVSVATGINGMATKSATISAANKMITVANAAGENVSICTIDGKVVYNAVASDVVSVPVEGGIYIVKVGKAVVKAIVK